MNKRSRSSMLKDLGLNKPTARLKEDDFFRDLRMNILEDKLIPIIGDTVRNEHIFDVNFDEELGVDEDDVDAAQPELSDAAADDDDEETEADQEPVTNITEMLASLWADAIGYPMLDRFDMARVAQFHAVKMGEFKAKTDYLDFHKECILEIAGRLAEYQEDDEAMTYVAELRRQRDRMSFAQIVTELDFPRFPARRSDPLRILAKLPLSIYLTTSHYDFMERALLLEGRKPRTRLCLWNLESANIDEIHRFDPDYTPDPDNPVVYHLYGLETYPSSMVLSEDDYLAFLVRLARDNPDDSGDRVIPPWLEAELRESSLLLMGYRLQDWDFRVLFRGLINTNANLIRSRRPSVAIQFDPKEQSGISSEEEARKYLDHYFNIANFRVHWGNSDEFVATLWKKWQEFNSGGRPS